MSFTPSHSSGKVANDAVDSPNRYERPALVVLGSVAEFTLGSGVVTSDAVLPGDQFSK
jgi:hypothetical protein